MTAPPPVPPLTPPVTILMYHQIGHFANPRQHRACYCDTGRFRRQMAWFHFWRYNIISIADARACLFEGKPVPPRAIVLTFDDGCENFREHAWPVLRRYNFPATMFVIPGMLGGTTAWMDGAAGRTPLMDAATVRELRREGLGIGSHTLNHVRLAQCAPAVAREEVFTSKAKLEDLLGEPVADFCYPYGDYNAGVAQMVAEAGYKTGLTCLRANANYAKSPLELPRKAVSYGMTLPGFLWQIHGKNAPKIRAKK
jgi:peptidoglycan/xylan/chitin deacetylase (PgdA/CDA1 family)